MKKILFVLPAFLLLLLIATGCEDDAELPQVITLEVNDITEFSALGSGEVISDGGAPVIERGLLWDTSPDPELETAEGIALGGQGEGEFSAEMTGLTPGTSYYARAYATNNQGTAYGEIIPFVTPDVPAGLLIPGNWLNVGGAATYSWVDDVGNSQGFIFGTNLFGDKGYAQLFQTGESHTIEGAIYWISVREGTAGEVVFALWDYADAAPGELLASRTLPMADITPSTNFDNAMYVEFDEAVTTSGDFLVGVDISGLNEFVEGQYELGNVSSQDGDGLQAGLALILLEDGSWETSLEFGMDVDIAIFPLERGSAKGEDAGKLLMESPSFFFPVPVQAVRPVRDAPHRQK